ncbi:MAG: DUF2190 family protein [Gammaproteobacteria bacterium]|nr:DUF2190 family protein [Gammaproteobacteria bacterium]
MSRNHTPTLTLTVVATGVIVADRFITPTGAQAGADANALGVSRFAGVSGDKLTVDVMGTAVLETGAAITLGQTVKVDATGRAIPWVTAGARVGIALEAASGAGQFIEVFLIPNAV